MTERTSAATTITLLPGASEDSSEPEGDDLDSAMPDYEGKCLDAWFIADQVTALPDDLDAVEEMRRELPEYETGLKQYRLKNRIELAFTTPDGRTVADGTPRLETNGDEPPPYVAIEGQKGEENLVRELVDREDIDWFDGREKLRAETDRFESDLVREEVGDIEGVRASALFGGRDTYITIMKRKFDELGPVRFLERTGMDAEVVPAFIVRPPTMYTFLELAVMADGTTLARVWDVSRYPKHYLYAEGTARDETAFEKGSRASGGDWRENENVNEQFGGWVMEEQDPQSPFSPNIGVAYEQYLDFTTSFNRRPAMTHGEDGTELTARELSLRLPPLFPW